MIRLFQLILRHYCSFNIYCHYRFPPIQPFQPFTATSCHFNPFPSISDITAIVRNVHQLSGIPAISSHFQLFQPFPAISSQSCHFKQFSDIPPFPVIQSHSQPFLAFSSHFKPFQEIPAISSHFQPIQPFPASSSHHSIITSSYHPIFHHSSLILILLNLIESKIPQPLWRGQTSKEANSS